MSHNNFVKACSLFACALDQSDFGEDYANLIKREALESKHDLKHHWQNYWMWAYSIHFHLFYKYISPAQLNAYNQEQSTAKIHNLVNFMCLPPFHWHVC
jgi:hypothetical protein